RNIECGSASAASVCAPDGELLRGIHWRCGSKAAPHLSARRPGEDSRRRFHLGEDGAGRSSRDHQTTAILRLAYESRRREPQRCCPGGFETIDTRPDRLDSTWRDPRIEASSSTTNRLRRSQSWLTGTPSPQRELKGRPLASLWVAPHPPPC